MHTPSPSGNRDQLAKQFGQACTHAYMLILGMDGPSTMKVPDPKIAVNQQLKVDLMKELEELEVLLQQRLDAAVPQAPVNALVHEPEPCMNASEDGPTNAVVEHAKPMHIAPLPPCISQKLIFVKCCACDAV